MSNADSNAIDLRTAVIVDWNTELPNKIINDATDAAVRDHGQADFSINRAAVQGTALAKCYQAFKFSYSGESWDHAYEGARESIDEQFRKAGKNPDHSVHEFPGRSSGGPNGRKQSHAGDRQPAARSEAKPGEPSSTCRPPRPSSAAH
jgi:hypothetical protein